MKGAIGGISKPVAFIFAEQIPDGYFLLLEHLNESFGFAHWHPRVIFTLNHKHGAFDVLRVVQGRDPFCRQLLAGRYAHDVSELVAAAAASQ